MKLKLSIFPLLFLPLLFITSCKADEESEENEDGSSVTTYSSCKITSSSALLSSDRANDLQQCWDGVDYESQGDAQQWCETQVNAYMSSRYLFGHTIEYAVETTNCPE